MNRATIRRWLNEYLDGEIGLADKIELERLMAEHPEIRKEYKELRRIGLHLGSMPEVTVHPVRFRGKVLSALEEKNQTFFTPQRTFAGSMLIALVVFGLMFGLMLYNDMLLGDRVINTDTQSFQAASDQVYSLKLDIHTDSENFFNRLLVEADLGMINPSALNAFTSQTRVFEGAVCAHGGGLDNVVFNTRTPSIIEVIISPRDVLTIGKVSEGLTGIPAEITAANSGGDTLSLNEFVELHGNSKPVKLTLSFK